MDKNVAAAVIVVVFTDVVISVVLVGCLIRFDLRFLRFLICCLFYLFFNAITLLQPIHLFQLIFDP